MTARKVILWSLSIPFLIFLLLYFTQGDRFNLSESILIAVVLLAIWGIGLFAGLILFAIFFKPEKANPWHYIYGQAIVFGGIFIYIIILEIREDRPRSKFRNIEHNHSIVNLDRNGSDSVLIGNEKYIKIAFKNLESTFTDPNSFRIDSWLSDSKDTIISSYSETLHFVYFIYTTKGDTKQIARVSVLKNKPHIDIRNGGPDTFEEYALIKNKIDGLIKNALDSARTAIDQLSDTLAEKGKAKEILNEFDKQ